MIVVSLTRRGNCGRVGRAAFGGGDGQRELLVGHQVTEEHGLAAVGRAHAQNHAFDGIPHKNKLVR